MIATRRPIHGEVPFNGRHGRRVYDYIFAPVFDASGDIEAVAGTARDTTERKAMEETLREQDRRKDDFIALLAHELRNPLAPIRNGLQVLRLAGSDMDAVGQARAMMDRQLTHMVRLIDDLLDVSRISRNKMELRNERVLLGDVVSSAVETARPLIDAAGHELILSIPPLPVFLDADLTRLAQVFSNLLTNSAKYTPSGGKIWLSAEHRHEEVVVSVRDTGIGIPAESLENIFEMFSQVDRSIERNAGGLGIGLAAGEGGWSRCMAGQSARRARVRTWEAHSLSLFRWRWTSRNNRWSFQVTGKRSRDRSDAFLSWMITSDGAASLAMMLRLLGNEVQTANDGISSGGSQQSSSIQRRSSWIWRCRVSMASGRNAAYSRAGVGAGFPLLR